MDEIETNFRDTQEIKPLVWFRYIDDFFFLWTHGKETLNLKIKHPNIKSTHEFNNESIPFRDLKVTFYWDQLTTNLHIKSTENISTCARHLLIQTIPNVSLFLVKL